MGFQNIVRTVLRLIFAAGGLVLLFHGSFSKMQFEEQVILKGMCFIILSLGVGLFVYKPLKCNDTFEKLCQMHFLVNAVVKFLLLGLFSMVIFFTKYPGLKIHHSNSEEEEGMRSRKAYDLFGIGSFSFFALVISWERKHGGAGFGIFEFMLELTMDASMEIPAGHEDGSGPDRWYMVGAYVYCFLLLIIRSYVNSSSTEPEIARREIDFGLTSGNHEDDERNRRRLRDQNDQPPGTDLELGLSLTEWQDRPLQDQNDQPPRTDLDAIDLESGLGNNDVRVNNFVINLGNYDVDRLRRLAENWIEAFLERRIRALFPGVHRA